MLKHLYLLACVFLLLACSRNKSEDDNILPLIQLLSPTENQSFTGGQTISITGNISDNDNLAELHVHISNHITGQLLIDIHRYPSSANYTLNESFPAQAGISYKIQVLAIDKSGNQQIATVHVTAN